MFGVNPQTNIFNEWLKFKFRQDIGYSYVNIIMIYLQITYFVFQQNYVLS